MKKQIVKLFFFLTLMMVSVVGKGQNWTWTGETWKDASTKYYLRQASADRYITGDNKIVTDINSAALWTISSTSSRATIQAVDGQKIHNENQTWYVASESVNESPAYNFQASNYYIYISNNAINTSNWKNTYNSTKNWYLISEDQKTAYDNFIAAWTKLNTLSELNPSMPKASEVTNALKAATNYSNAATNTKTLNDLYTACFEAATKENPLNVTMFIKNPGYEASTWNEGWTVDGFVEHGNDGKFVGSHIAEMWSADLVSGSVKQTVYLPQGVYVLKAKISAGFDGTEQYMYAKTTAETRKTYVSGKDGDPAEYHEVMFRVLPGDNGQAEIGFNRENIRWWTAVDDWSLQYLGETPAFTYEMGTRLDGTRVSKPAYTSTPADGVDPEHADDALLVVTWPNNMTNDPWAEFKIAKDAKATVTADGVNTQVDLLSSFRSSTYNNGFGIYIPDFDENKVYTVTFPANSIGFDVINANAYGESNNVMNEAFTINAEQSPLRDGKYFVVVDVDGVTMHMSRGKKWGTQAILDYYGVPVLVQTAGLTTFKFVDNNAFLGSGVNDDWLYTDRPGDETCRRFVLEPQGNDEYKFLNPARDKYIYYGKPDGYVDYAIMEGEQGASMKFETLDSEGYPIHLKGISDDEAKRVAHRADLAVNTREEYDALIAQLEEDDNKVSLIFPSNDTEKTVSEKYHEARNTDLIHAWGTEGFGENYQPKDLIGSEKQTLTLNEGLYCVGLNAFQQAAKIEFLTANQGFRGLTYYYVKVGTGDNAVVSKDQLKSITETTGTYPTDEASAKEAFKNGEYYSRILFYVPENNTQVEFGIENPQRLGNNIDETAGSWVAFQNLKVEKFDALETIDVNLTVKAEKYGTFVAPYNVTLPDGITAYTAKVNDSKTYVNLTEYNGSELAAGTPVILKNTTGGTITKDYSKNGVIIKNSVTDGVLTGFYVAEQTIPVNSYVLQDQNDGNGQMFYKVVDTFVGTKNRCYLNEEVASLARLRIMVDGEETSIEEMFGTSDSPVEYYSVNGTKLSAPQKGINLVKMSDSTVKKIFVK